MTALSFVLSRVDSRQPASYAVVCVDARYAGVLMRGGERIARRFATPESWQRLEAEIRDRLRAGPLDPLSAIVQILVDADERSGLVVQCLASQPIDVAPSAVAATLDGLLRGLSSLPALGQKLSHEPQ